MRARRSSVPPPQVRSEIDLPQVTDRQADVLAFVWECIQFDHLRRGPTYREIGRVFGIAPTNAWGHVQALIDRGCLLSRVDLGLTMSVTVAGLAVVEAWRGDLIVPTVDPRIETRRTNPNARRG